MSGGFAESSGATLCEKGSLAGLSAPFVCTLWAISFRLSPQPCVPTWTRDGSQPLCLSLVRSPHTHTHTHTHTPALTHAHTHLQRQSLKLLSELLLDRDNFAIMMRYIVDRSNLRIIMGLLRHNQPNIQFEAFHVFKVRADGQSDARCAVSIWCAASVPSNGLGDRAC